MCLELLGPRSEEILQSWKKGQTLNSVTVTASKAGYALQILPSTGNRGDEMYVMANVVNIETGKALNKQPLKKASAEALLAQLSKK